MRVQSKSNRRFVLGQEVGSFRLPPELSKTEPRVSSEQGPVAQSWGLGMKFGPSPQFVACH